MHTNYQMKYDNSDKFLLLLLLCSRPSAELTMRLHEMPPLLSVSYQFHRCFNVCIFLLQIFFHVVNPHFPLFSSAPHAFDVAVKCLMWESIIFHTFHMTEPCKSSFLDFVDYCFLLLQYIPDSFIPHFLQSRDCQYFSEPTHFC